MSKRIIYKRYSSYCQKMPELLPLYAKNASSCWSTLALVRRRPDSLSTPALVSVLSPAISAESAAIVWSVLDETSLWSDSLACPPGVSTCATEERVFRRQ